MHLYNRVGLSSITVLTVYVTLLYCIVLYLVVPVSFGSSLLALYSNLVTLVLNTISVHWLFYAVICLGAYLEGWTMKKEGNKWTVQSFHGRGKNNPINFLLKGQHIFLSKFLATSSSGLHKLLL